MTIMCQLGKVTESAIEVKRKWDNQLQKYLRDCTVFWLKWPVHDLVLVTPPPPLHPFSKLLDYDYDYAQNLEEQLWMGGGEGGHYFISQTCD